MVGSLVFVCHKAHVTLMHRKAFRVVVFIRQESDDNSQIALSHLSQHAVIFHRYLIINLTKMDKGNSLQNNSLSRAVRGARFKFA